jgi:hypothetical protein
MEVFLKVDLSRGADFQAVFHGFAIKRDSENTPFSTLRDLRASHSSGTGVEPA